jgi:hypothetical protein
MIKRKNKNEWDPEEALIEKIAALDMEELLKDDKEPFNIVIPYFHRFRIRIGGRPANACKGTEPDNPLM